MEWTLADAMSRLSEVLARALTEGPQRVRVGEAAVVVLAQHEYDRLAGSRPDFKTFLLKGPGFEGLDLVRDRSLLRPEPENGARPGQSDFLPT